MDKLHHLDSVVHMYRVKIPLFNLHNEVTDHFVIRDGNIISALIVVDYKISTMNEEGERIVHVTIHPEVKNKGFQFKQYEFKANNVAYYRSEILMKKAIELWLETIKEAKGVQNAIPHTE